MKFINKVAEHPITKTICLFWLGIIMFFLKNHFLKYSEYFPGNSEVTPIPYYTLETFNAILIFSPFLLYIGILLRSSGDKGEDIKEAGNMLISFVVLFLIFEIGSILSQFYPFI